MDSLHSVQSRRALLKSALVVAGGAAISGCARHIETAAAPAAPAHVDLPPFPRAPVLVKATPRAPAGVRPDLFAQAMAALDRNGTRVPSHDRVALVDFSIPSYRPRLHLINLGNGTVRHYLVSHGIGSDPAHTGVLQRFSNEINSEATCEGALVTEAYYYGKHGHSQRLIGLEPTNYNAYDRAIVVHSAWYANTEMVAKHGKLGRSQGCFAVGLNELAKVFEELGPGRMIYSAKT